MNAALDLETCLRVPYVEPYGGFDLSPDGRQVAFAWNITGRWEVYTLALDGQPADPRQITSGAGAKLTPRWSPDGRLTYLLDLDGGEQYDLIVFDPADGNHTNLTPDTPYALQPNYCWSPDSRWIAFACDLSGRFGTYIIPAGGGAARPVHTTHHPDWEMQFSPDGRWLAVVSEAKGQNYQTTVVSVAGDAPSRTISMDGVPISARDARWSPDGRQLAFSSDLHGYHDIGLYGLDTGEASWLTSGPGDKEYPGWSPDGRYLAYVFSNGPVSSLALVEPGHGLVASFQLKPGIHHPAQFTPDGSSLVFAFENPGHPADLWQLSLADGAFRQLTRSLPAPLHEAMFVMPVQVQYPSMDGTRVPALLFRPEQSGPLPPAVITIHGGPNWLTRVSWDPLIQQIVGRGWVVLAPNYRGSTGYGRDWQLASRYNFGRVDTQDVVAAAQYLIRQGMADPTRIAVTGRSWGGYLTMTCLTQYPELWAAGSAVVPFLNWFTAHTNSRDDLQHWDLENFGHPEKDRALYRERSPFFFLDRVRAPVQLICGAHDPRCPASESIQARDALAALGKPCDLVLYPDEGHSFLNTDNEVDANQRLVDFLARTLEPEQ